MNCPKCNAQNQDGTNFCSACGAPLTGNNASVNGNQNYYQNNQNYQQPPYQGQPNYQQPPYQGQPNYQQPPYQGQPNYQQPPFNGGRAPITKRDIAVAIILSLVTCGIYSIFWLVSLVDDLNVAGDTPNDTSGGMVFLLTLVTCGIYGIYWAYTAGKKVSYITQKYSGIATDNSIVYLILALFGFSIINYALIQNELNKVAAN